MKILWLLLLLVGCRREVVKEQHTITEAAESKASQVKVDVVTTRHVTEEPGKITEEDEVQIFDPPLRDDLKPIIREIRRKKTVTETGAKKDDLRVAWHGFSNEVAKAALRVNEDVMDRSKSEPSVGFDSIGWTISAVLILVVLFIAWRVWPKR